MAQIIATKQYYVSHEEWEEIRKGLIAEGRIGGSMVGTAAGLDPWKSPYELWAELTGKITAEDISDKEAIIVGHDLEDYVAERFCRMTGRKVHRENCIMTNEEYPHLFASIDRKVENEASGLECKTANAYREGAFTEGNFPDGYYRQVKTYLAVTGLERWYLAVLVMGISFRVYMVTRKAEDMEKLPAWVSGARLVSEMELEECEEDAAAFIEGHVKSGIAPAMVGAEGERAAINEVNGNRSEGTVELGADIEALIARRAELKKHAEANAEELKKIENEIVAALGGKETGIGAEWKVTYKYADTRRLDKDAVAAALGGTIPENCYKVTNGPTLRITPVKKNYR